MISNIPCPTCNVLMEDARGLGETMPRLICRNNRCQSHYTRYKCPECDSSEKTNIDLRGLGDLVFTCKKCGYKWNSLDNV